MSPILRYYDRWPKGKRMSTIATVSSKFQIPIPKEVRDHLALRPGEKVAFIAKPEGFLIVRVPKREDLAGMARGANTEGYRDRNDRY
jgi:AbrB family looped-hinge helix DNA binding protein